MIRSIIRRVNAATQRNENAPVIRNVKNERLGAIVTGTVAVGVGMVCRADAAVPADVTTMLADTALAAAAIFTARLVWQNGALVTRLVNKAIRTVTH